MALKKEPHRIWPGERAEIPAELKRQHAGTLNTKGSKELPGEADYYDENYCEEDGENLVIETDLESIQDRINYLQGRIERNEEHVGTILVDSLQHARRIGNLLGMVKSLLPHGKYQEWVEEHFYGSAATARAYKQIAENWKEIEWQKGKGKVRKISIREALDLLNEKIPPEPGYRYGVDELLGKFERMISSWPGKVCEALAYDWDDELRKPAWNLFYDYYRKKYGAIKRKQERRANVKVLPKPKQAAA
jgi:hypothetical protein